MNTLPNFESNNKLAYSLKEVAEITGLSKGLLHKLLNEGQLTRRKVGKRTLVLHCDLEVFLRGRPTKKWGGGRKSSISGSQT